jgi:hypothetical protein
MTNFKLIPEEAFLPVEKDKNWLEDLYPSVAKMQAERDASRVPPDWDEDPRVLTSAMYPSMRRNNKWKR